MVHPILNTFHVRYETCFMNGNAWTGNATLLPDALNNRFIRLTPASALDSTHIECTLVFKGPNGVLYKAPYKFVGGNKENYKFENPTIIDLAKDAKFVGEFIDLELRICKEKNDTLKSEDKDKKKTFQVERFLDGTRVNFDDEFSSLKKKKAKPLTPNQLAKLVDLYTVYILIRRAHWDSNEEKFVPETKILCCSNAFTLESSQVKISQYDYTPNRLKINIIDFSPDAAFPNTNQYKLELSYTIPPLYECTQLKHKYLQIKIITTSEEDPQIHPNYKLITDHGLPDSILIAVDQYEASVSLKVMKMTWDQINQGLQKNQNLPVTYINSSAAVLPPMLMNNGIFCVELHLCDNTTGETVPYPHSIVKSKPIIDEFNSFEGLNQLALPIVGNLIEENLEPPALHDKRSFENDINQSSAFPPMKSKKI